MILKRSKKQISIPTIQTKGVVFSQTSLATPSLLKASDLDPSKLKKSQVNGLNGSNGVMAGGKLEKPPPSPSPTTSFSEEYLKQEAETSTMFHETDCEFFQDLVQWCSAPAKGDQAQTIDSLKSIQARALNTDKKHTPFSPQGWEIFDANSPHTPAGLLPTTPNDPLSPTMDGFMFETDFANPTDVKKLPFQEQILDINSLPVVFEDFASEKPVSESWLAPQPSDWATHNTKEQETTYNTMPFIDQEDSLDMKLVSVIPRQVESNDVVVSEFVLNPTPSLALNVTARAPPQAISTPEVLSFVEQLEEKLPTVAQTTTPTQQWIDTGFIDADSFTNASLAQYEPITPRSESPPPSDTESTKRSKRKRRISEDSDDSYTPLTEYTPRKYKRRKPRLPIKDMILALEGSQQLPKARRGRPPKRRESVVSSTCSVDDNVSNTSTHEMKYRELRDKNNEASKRSRMNRKLKELQMEQLAIELEERNQKLRVRADVLEDMTKRLKDALMTAIMQK